MKPKKEKQQYTPTYYDVGRERNGEYPRADGWEGPVVRIRLPQCPPLAKYSKGDRVFLRVDSLVRDTNAGEIELALKRIGVAPTPPLLKKE